MITDVEVWEGLSGSVHFDQSRIENDYPEMQVSVRRVIHPEEGEQIQLSVLICTSIATGGRIELCDELILTRDKADLFVKACTKVWESNGVKKHD